MSLSKEAEREVTIFFSERYKIKKRKFDRLYNKWRRNIISEENLTFKKREERKIAYDKYRKRESFNKIKVANEKQLEAWKDYESFCEIIWDYKRGV